MTQQCENSSSGQSAEDPQKIIMVRVARSARTPSPVAGRRRQRLSGGRTAKSPKHKNNNSQPRVGLRRSLSKKNLSSSETESPKMRRNRSFGSRSRSGSLSRRRTMNTLLLATDVLDPQEGCGGVSMRRNASFGKQLNRSSNSNNKRRGSKSPIAKRNALITLNGSGVTDEVDPQEGSGGVSMRRNHSFGKQLNRSSSNSSNNNNRRGSKSPVSKRNAPLSQTRSSGRRRISQRSSSGGSSNNNNNNNNNLGTPQLNVFQTLERGLISSSSSNNNNTKKPQLAPSKDNDAHCGTTRHTIPGLNKPKTEENRETIKRSSEPAKLELDGGVQHAGPYGRRFSWWNLPSSRDLGVDLEEDDFLEEDDLLPEAVPPSRRKSIMQEGEKSTSSIKMEETPPRKQSSKKANNRSSTGSRKKKNMRSRSLDSDAIDAMLSPAIQKPSIGGEDFLSPLPSLSKQYSSGTCATESTNGSGSSVKRTSKQERRTKQKTKRKSGKGGGSKRGNRSISVKQQTAEIKQDTSKISLEDHFSRSMNTSFRSMNNRSCDFSAHSRGSTKRSTRTSMSIKQHSSMDASRSSMSLSLASDDQDGFSIGSDFEGSADFDFDDDDDDFFQKKDDPAMMMSISNGGGESSSFFHAGENSFQVLDDDSKREMRCRMKDKTQRSSGGGGGRKSPLPVTSPMQQRTTTVVQM